MNCEEFSLRLSRDCAVTPGMHVLAAVSGGADSMALLCFLLEIRDAYPLHLSCVHIEHGIREEASLEDMRFVASFCGEKHIAFYPHRVNVRAFAAREGRSLEEAARLLRHALLQKTAEQIGADVIALAHHRQDQAETVLLHALRGSDIRGLCAMGYRSGNLIRPLLDVQPKELRAYLTARGQEWREDETNGDVRYSRNRIRCKVMPELESISAGASGALCRLALAASRDEDYFAGEIDKLGLCASILPGGAALNRQTLEGLHPALLSRVLTRLIDAAGMQCQSARAIEEMAAALNRGEGTVNLTDGAHACVGREFFCVYTAEPPEIDMPLAASGVTDTPLGRFIVRRAAPGETGDGVHAQVMPLRMLEGARVSVRRNGDVMIPFGQHTPVKLKKLMIDAGIDRAMRRGVPVIRNGLGVVWAVGLRPGEMCRVNADDVQMIVEYCGLQKRMLSEKENIR